MAFIATAIICLLFFFLAGCKAQQLSDSRIIWVEDAKCVMYAETLNATQAQKVAREMQLHGCKITIENDLNEKE